MTNVATKASLPPAGRRLVELMQGINFGRIEGLIVRSGEPVLDPPPHDVRKFKFCAENGPRPEATIEDFLLKAEVRDLFVQLQVLGNATIPVLHVKHGLPFCMEVEEDAASGPG